MNLLSDQYILKEYYEENANDLYEFWRGLQNFYKPLYES
jgi:hypothetical protein